MIVATTEKKNNNRILEYLASMKIKRGLEKTKATWLQFLAMLLVIKFHVALVLGATEY